MGGVVGHLVLCPSGHRGLGEFREVESQGLTVKLPRYLKPQHAEKMVKFAQCFRVTCRQLQSIYWRWGGKKFNIIFSLYYIIFIRKNEYKEIGRILNIEYVQNFPIKSSKHLIRNLSILP